jgi:PEP-CTERM motif
MRKLLLATTALLALSAFPAKADVTLGGQNWTFAGADNLTLTPVVPGGNQPQNIQCIICGDNQPQQQADFGYTDFKNSGNLNDAVFFSTNVPGGANPGLNTIGTPYSGDFLRAYLLAGGDPTLTFNIGIDVNDTGKAQTLESFYLLNFTTKTVLAAYTGNQDVLSQNNGTGFPDYTLGTFNITLGTDIHQGDQLIFFANLNNLNDGPDSFFLVPVVQAVPEPATWAMMILGFLGVAAVGARKQWAGFRVA